MRRSGRFVRFRAVTVGLASDREGFDRRFIQPGYPRPPETPQIVRLSYWRIAHRWSHLTVALANLSRSQPSVRTVDHSTHRGVARSRVLASDPLPFPTFVACRWNLSSLPHRACRCAWARRTVYHSNNRLVATQLYDRSWADAGLRFQKGLVVEWSCHFRVVVVEISRVLVTAPGRYIAVTTTRWVVDRSTRRAGVGQIDPAVKYGGRIVVPLTGRPPGGSCLDVPWCHFCDPATATMTRDNEIPRCACGRTVGSPNGRDEGDRNDRDAQPQRRGSMTEPSCAILQRVGGGGARRSAMTTASSRKQIPARRQSGVGHRGMVDPYAPAAGSIRSGPEFRRVGASGSRSQNILAVVVSSRRVIACAAPRQWA